MIELRGVGKSFPTADAGAVPALLDIDLTIRDHEFFTLLGPSGCGKTTLLRLIAGFEAPTTGQLLIDGRDVASLPPQARSVNTVFQSYALFPHMSVAENVAFGLEMLKVPRAAIQARVGEALSLVRLDAYAARRPAQLSGGQQQRVALARALAPKPSVLLLDEPLSALDLKLRKETQGELKRLQRETGITFVLVTHDQEEALALSDRLAVMSAGRILQVGEPRAIYDEPADRFVADFIGEANLIPGPLLGRHADRVVAIRPERASLHDAEAGGLLSGTIAAVTFLGLDTLYEVSLDGRERFRVRRRETVGPMRVGDRVALDWPTEAERELPGQGGAP